MTLRNNRGRAAAFAAVIAALSPSAALAAAPGASGNTSYAGLQLFVVAGVHRDVAGNQYGVGGGPLVQVRVAVRRAALIVEGIPVVSIPGTRPSALYGQATPALGIFNGEAEFALDERERLWAGVGSTVYNQRTPLPGIQQQVTSRMSGVRFALRYRTPLPSLRFLEARVAATPALFGNDHFVYSDGVTPPVDKDERASEVDASLAYGWDRNASEWLVGIRTLNFSAKFVRAGDAADRNVGIGVLFEWRHVFTKERSPRMQADDAAGSSALRP